MIAFAQGTFYLGGAADGTFSSWMAGLLAIASGTSLLLGFLTPVGAAAAGLGCAGLAFSWFPPPAPNLIELKLTAFLVIAVASAIVFLGPGAISIDARLFGRREIIIPRPSHRPKDL